MCTSERNTHELEREKGCTQDRRDNSSAYFVMCSLQASAGTSEGEKHVREREGAPHQPTFIILPEMSDPSPPKERVHQRAKPQSSETERVRESQRKSQRERERDPTARYALTEHEQHRAQLSPRGVLLTGSHTRTKRNQNGKRWVDGSKLQCVCCVVLAANRPIRAGMQLTSQHNTSS
uniref:Uncharacterized protein n=1 Tax=Vitrella brassicaformis TaxID=1169539 RepID=A0A7S1KI34_9ALVE|mmetsp:Transcript_6491/g.15700  ORF Transcript_6491/g.15700 Transcript_6491/m.15700 type:complete len:178 (+) Transcript_6491:405-938(+)